MSFYIGRIFRQNWAEELRIPPRSEALPLERELEGRDRAQERPGERDIRTGAEDAEYRSGSDAKKGERLLLRK